MLVYKYLMTDNLNARFQSDHQQLYQSIRLNYVDVRTNIKNERSFQKSQKSRKGVTVKTH